MPLIEEFKDSQPENELVWLLAASPAPPFRFLNYLIDKEIHAFSEVADQARSFIFFIEQVDQIAA